MTEGTPTEPDMEPGVDSGEDCKEAAGLHGKDADGGMGDDAFAMMAGMGEEQEDKVTLVEDKAGPEDEEAGAAEEEAAGDMGDDAFAMMAGMGEEQEYKVTLVEDTAGRADEEAGAAEEEADG